MKIIEKRGLNGSTRERYLLERDLSWEELPIARKGQTTAQNGQILVGSLHERVRPISSVLVKTAQIVGSDPLVQWGQSGQISP